ncbi:MAG: ATP/GTP-binding protein, partial [Actinomycetota bacterium]|nr:ATP/GTP-binding protein [Actinomycetota bacterium]
MSLRPGPRGWTNRAGGASAYVEAAPEWRGTSVQVCGLWPFIAGSGSPMVGVPLGKHLFTNTTVCSDPINWFTRAKLISNPGVMVLGLTGRGKSTVVRRMATGLAAQGVN